MAYTALQLITRSWFLSGIVARNLQGVTGDQATDGLTLLNALLDFKQIETDLLPYWTYIEMPLVAGQEYYFLPNVAAIESSTFNISNVRYPMDSVTRRNYFGSSRVDSISTLPFSWNYNRGQNGGTFSTYFLPESNYPLKMMVKLFLNDLTLFTDLNNAFSPLASGFVSNIVVTAGGSGFTSIPTVTLSGGGGTGATAYATVTNSIVTSVNIVSAGSGYTSAPTIAITGGGGSGAAATASTSNYTFLQTANAGFDNSYLEYLRYALANYMCSEYGIMFNPESALILKQMQRKLAYMSPPDLSMVKTSILTDTPGLNFGDINIGHSWRP